MRYKTLIEILVIGVLFAVTVTILALYLNPIEMFNHGSSTMDGFEQIVTNDTMRR